MPLSGLSICAVGDRVVVRDGNSQFQVDSGQYVLGLDVTVEDGVLRVVEKEFGTRDEDGPEPPRNAEDWFDDGLDFEENGDIDQAIEAYKQTVALDGQNVAAWINWGRLLHDRGNQREAEAVYRRAIELCGPDSVLMFNLGVLLEDLGRTLAALEAYQSAVGEDPALADGHYNLARLYEALGQPQHAIRHLGQYRRLLNQRDAADMALWVGTSGYDYPEWRGSFYPEKMPTAKMLPYYAERFPTVEINNTFYRMPNAKILAGWSAQVPERFRLTLKAPQRITHQKRGCATAPTT